MKNFLSSLAIMAAVIFIAFGMVPKGTRPDSCETCAPSPNRLAFQGEPYEYEFVKISDQDGMVTGNYRKRDASCQNPWNPKYSSLYCWADLTTQVSPETAPFVHRLSDGTYVWRYTYIGERAVPVTE